MPFKRNDAVATKLVGKTAGADQTPKTTDIPTKVEIPLTDESGRAIFNFHAKPDGEKRTRRLQIACKESVAAQAAVMVRERGLSLNYFIEKQITEEYQRTHGKK